MQAERDGDKGKQGRQAEGDEARSEYDEAENMNASSLGTSISFFQISVSLSRSFLTSSVNIASCA